MTPASAHANLRGCSRERVSSAQLHSSKTLRWKDAHKSATKFESLVPQSLRHAMKSVLCLSSAQQDLREPLVYPFGSGGPRAADELIRSMGFQKYSPTGVAVDGFSDDEGH
eukprot:6465508-Amphidinium_carterae.2